MKLKVFITIFTLATLYGVSQVYAQAPECLPSGSPATPRADFLVTATNLIGKFGSAKQVCVVGDRAAFVSYKIPSYNDLKSIYYTQVKSSTSFEKLPTLTGNRAHGDIPLTSNQDHLYHIAGNLVISGNIPGNTSGNRSGVIFIDGNLTISTNIGNGSVSNDAGIVFVTSGDVVIDPVVTRIDGVIISSGTIFTAGEGCATNAVGGSSPLVINGSLISLNSLKPIKFCRKLDNNTQPAEKINHQSKYVVILRNIFSDTLQKWSEIP